MHGFRKDSAYGGARPVDAEDGGQGGGDVYGRDDAVVCAGDERRAVEVERNVAVVAVGREVGGAGAAPRKLVRAEVDVERPADVRRIAVGDKAAVLRVRSKMTFSTSPTAWLPTRTFLPSFLA